MEASREYTSPLDDLVEPSDFAFELPSAAEGEVVLVDDDADAGALNRAILEKVGHAVHQFMSPTEALAHLNGAPTVLVTDFEMPEMSGLALAERALEIDPEVKVILLTGSGDEATAQAALRMGVSDYIRKPPEAHTLIRSVQKAFHTRAADEYHRSMVAWMREELDRRATAIREITVGSLASLTNVLEMRSPHFHGHSRAVAMQAAAVAEALGLSARDVEWVRTAGLLHDVGMIAVPDRLVEKPSALTPAELDLIRSHPDLGVEILEPMKHLGPAIRFVHEHHERWDGSGYPNGKRGDEISLGGQILGISEAWIALLQSRAYREAGSREQARRMLEERSGEWFSEPIVQALGRADLGMI